MESKYTVNQVNDAAQTILEIGHLPSTIDNARNGKVGGVWDIANKFPKTIKSKMAKIINSRLG